MKIEAARSEKNRLMQEKYSQLLSRFGIDNLDGLSSMPAPEPRTRDFGGCVPGCEICEGIGVLTDTDGKSFPCPNNPLRFYQTGVGEGDLEIMQKIPKTENLKNIKAALKTVLDARAGMVTIYGAPGIGKTVSAKAFTVLAVERRMRAIYVRQSEMINDLRSAFDAVQGQLEYNARLERYKTADWLVIDELGRDRMTDFAQESLSEIIDARYTAAITGKAATVLISNSAPEAIFQAYVVDRIRDRRNQVLNLRGKSLRGG
jgi:hypothetical protein